MIIETKFNIGDRFFFLTCTTCKGKVRCKACDGDRIIFLKDQSTIECPKCWGNGGRSNPALMEWLMGFPTGWTDLGALETQ